MEVKLFQHYYFKKLSFLYSIVVFSFLSKISYMFWNLVEWFLPFFHIFRNSSSFVFPHICYNNLAKNLTGIFIGIVLNLYVNLGRTDIFTIISLSIHGIQHLFGSLISLIGILFCSFQHTSPIHVLLDIYLSITFWETVNNIVFISKCSIPLIFLYISLISYNLANIPYS